MMIKADYHVHSDYSSDGKATMEQMIDQAIRLGLKSICFTDHMDYDYPVVKEGFDFRFNVDSYIAELSALREKYSQIIDIRTGIELGLQPGITKELDSLVKKYPFDFIIGSTHVYDHVDPYYPEYWAGITEEEGIRRFFLSIIDNCKEFQSFHVCGHIDYIVRYTPSIIACKKKLQAEMSASGSSGHMATAEIPAAIIEAVYPYPKYADILDEVLKTLLYFGKGIEVNTSGLRYGLGIPHPRTEVLKRYRELGGELITIGSDAHMPGQLCYEFDLASAMLRSLGFRYYSVFEQGKPIMLNL